MNARILTLVTEIALVVCPLATVADEGETQSPVPSALAGALKHPSAEVRRTAAESLGRLGPNARPAVPALKAALKDEAPQVRASSAYALGQIGADAKEAVPALATALNDESKQVREAAASALGNIGSAEAVSALVQVVSHDSNAIVRSVALDALQQIGPGAKHAVPDLIGLLGSGDRTVRDAVARVLGQIGPDAVAPLAAALKDKTPEVRGAAASALGQIRPTAKEAVPALAGALEDENAEVRHAAADALGQIGGGAEQAVPSLAAVLKDKTPEVRGAAASALGRIGPTAKQAVPALAGALEDTTAEVRHAAASALGQIGPTAKQAVPALLAALTDETAEVRQVAAYALGQIRDSQAVPGLSQALTKDADATVRACSIAALNNIDSYTKENIPDLAKAVTDPSPEVRQGVFSALRKMGADAKDAVPALRDALQDENFEVRRDAADALGAIGPAAKDAVPALRNALHDESFEVRWHAVDALGAIDPAAEETIAALTSALDDKTPAVRQHAASALGQIGGGAPVPDDVGKALVERLPNESDRDVAAAVVDALEQLVDALSEDALGHAIQQIEQCLDSDPANIPERLVGLRDKFEKAQKLKAAEKAGAWPLRLLRFFVRDWRGRLLLGAALYLLTTLAAWSVILAVAPLWILNVEERLARWPVLSPLRHLLLVSLFGYHRRVLDAWVAAHVEKARENFSSLSTVADRAIHVPMPVVLDGRTVPELTPASLRPVFSAKPARLLIVGDGGVGKTSLVCQVAKWGLAEDEFRRLGRHRMIPVLVEQELDRPFEETIYDELKKLTGEEEIPRRLFEQLTATQRILVIVDRFSETSEASRAKVFAGGTKSSVASLVVTSRIDEKLDTDAKTVLKPLHVIGNRLASFIEGYLTSRDQRDLFDDVEFFDACRRLCLMVGEQPITAMYARVYADQLVSAKREGQDALIGGPENIPELMLRYLKEVNHTTAKDKIDFTTILRHSKAVAWVCLEEALRPGRVSRAAALKALDADDPEALLEYLAGPLHLIQSIGSGGNAVRFILDPLAEYLAGLHLVDCYANREDQWEGFLARAEQQKEREKIRGFLLAVRDCCLATRADVPAFVAEKCAQLAGYDANRARKEQLDQRIRTNVANLNLPEAQDRLVAAQYLGYIGPEAGPAIPALIKALADKDWRVRATVAVALGKICAVQKGSVSSEAELPIADLQTLLEDEHPTVRACAAETLGQIGPRAKVAVAPIANRLHDEDSAVREAAAGALRRIGAGAGRAVPDLIKALHDEDWNVRREAGEALAAIGPESVDPLILALGAADEVIRWRAAEALARIGPLAVKAVPALAQALEDEDWGVRRNAAFALGRMGPAAQEAVDRLKQALGDQEKAVARTARSALEAIQSQTGGGGGSLVPG